MVRQLQLPLEVYCFTKTTKWTEYEEIAADIFDHLFVVAREFGLKIFQLSNVGTNRVIDE